MKKTYFSELKKSMNYLSKKNDTIFLGQAVEYKGTAMSNTLVDVPKSKKIELPVAEEFQMGISIGYLMKNLTPISIYPRWNFLILATNQLVNHLDKFEKMNNGKYKSKAIIRTSIGSKRPLHPQDQHIGDFSSAFKVMAKNIDIIILKETNEIFQAYKKAYNNKTKHSIIVEYGDYYNEK